MLTRRRLLAALPALAASASLRPRSLLAQAFAGPFRKKPVPPAPTFVYFGTDTAKGVARGIYLSHFDPGPGRLSPPQLVAETARPSFLALAPPTAGQRRLYAANEITDPSATITAFQIDAATGALKPINQVSSAGAAPCFFSIDATGRSAFVANYNGASIASYRIQPDGSLSDPIERIDYKDPRFGKRPSPSAGPSSGRQDAPHPHSVHLSPDNRFLLVNDLGSDEISIFPVDPQSAHLGPPTLFSNDRAGSGPRHLAFHPNGRWVYSINELDSTLDHLLWSTTSSRTAPHAQLVMAGTPVKTIAAGFPAARNTAAEVQLSSNGRFLYASNRGENSLAVFAIAAADGSLAPVQRIACGGKTPRHFTLDPTGRWLLCGNQDSASVAVFRVEPSTGRLNGPTQTLPLDSVMFTLFA